MRKTVILSLLAALVATWQPAGASTPQTRSAMQRIESLLRSKRWTDARAELSDLRKSLDPLTESSEIEHTDFLLAQCMVHAGAPDAEHALRRFITENPSSSYLNDAHFALACMLCDRGDAAAADEEFSRVDYRQLSPRERERYDIRVGYMRLTQGDTDSAQRRFERIPRGSEYDDHARYYLAYIDYKRGDYDRAYEGFRSIEHSASYRDVIPYYLLQIEFRRGNYTYVVENADRLLAASDDKVRADLMRVAAESWFRLGDYAKAVGYMKSYPADRMGREEHYITGYSLYRLARYDDAAASLVKVCGPDDELTQNASYHLADCYLRRGDKARAADCFSMASGGGYDAAIAEDALFNYGKLRYELGGGVFNEAINILKEYIERYPSSERATAARELLVAAYYNSRDYDAAYEAIKSDPAAMNDSDMRTALQKIAYFRGLEAFDRGDLDRAESCMKESAEVGVSPKYTALSSFWQGEIAYSRGDRERAVRCYEAYLRRAPRTEREYALAQYNLGYCLFDGRDMEHARDRFSAFVAAYPARDDYYYDAQNRLGDAQYSLRDFARASASYGKVAGSQSRHRYHAQWQKALIYGIQGKTQDKITALRAIVEADRGDYVDDAWYELGRTYLTQERYADGVKTLEAFVEAYDRSPYYLQALSDLGLAYFNLGDKSRSKEYYRRVVDEAPQSSEAAESMRGIREIYVAEGNVDEYFAYAEGKGMGGDVSGAARDSLSFAAARGAYLDGDASATEKLASYLRNYPSGANTDDALFYLSDCYVKSGERARAVETMSRLADRGRSQYSQRVLGVLAPMAYEEGMYDRSSKSYLALYEMLPAGDSRSAALSGYARAVIAKGDDDATAAMADMVSASGDATDDTRRKALFAKAGVLDRRGDAGGAMKIYERLASQTATAEGAESCYRLIEDRFAAGDYRRAEQMIYDFASTPIAYWRAKAFVVLGDIYVVDGNSFQARATYQSIVDGYRPEDDGIVDAARERIAKLKD